MQFNSNSSGKNPDNLIMMDDDENEIKSIDKNNNIGTGYIPQGNPLIQNDNQYNNVVKNPNNKTPLANDGYYSSNNNNVYGVGLEVENLTLDPKPQYQNQMYQPYQAQGGNLQNQNQQQQQFYGTQMHQFNANAPYAGGFYGSDNQAGMIMPGIPIQMGEPQQPIRNGAPLNQNIGGGAIVVLDGDQQIRQSLIFRIRKNTKWFTGCNACFTILLVINLLNKISLYNDDDGSSSDSNSNTIGNSINNSNSNGDSSNGLLRASAVISIIEYIIWFILIILAIHGLTSNKLHLVRYYIKGLIFCIAMEVLANILIFAGFGDSTAVKKVSFVIVFILTILILYSFIKNAKNLLNDIEQYKTKFGGNPINDQLNPNNQNQNNAMNQNMIQANIQFNQGYQQRQFGNGPNGNNNYNYNNNLNNNNNNARNNNNNFL